jgi:hypothetical protein
MSVEDTRHVVRAYHDAYCRRDVPAAAAVLGDQFRFSSPMMAFDSPQQHDAALNRFVPFITACELMSELYGEREAATAIRGPLEVASDIATRPDTPQ